MSTHRQLIKTVTGIAAAAALTLAGTSAASAQSITGAGSSFAYPIYSKWAYTYGKKTGVQLNYQSIGSGGGIKQIEAGNVDFGASDAPLKESDLEQHDLIQWPMAMGGVIPVVNISGIGAGQIRLDGKTLADIYMGNVKKWNDTEIKALNPNVALPDEAISVVHRSDASGTTWIFTNYLTKVSKQWANSLGNSTSVDWPVGRGGPQNNGVAAIVHRTEGSIGYVEYAYCLENHMAYVQLKNKAGKFVSPTAKNFQAAAAGADWKNAPGYYMVLTDQPGKKSWPITGATFILMHKTQKNVSQAQAVLKWCNWSLKHGQKEAQKLKYVAMPKSVVEMIENLWAKKMHGPNGNAIWPAH